MIQIDVMVMGASTATLQFTDLEKAAARKEYERYTDTLSCYAQVTVDGKRLTLAEARKFFRLPAVIKHTPQKVTAESKLPHYTRRRF